MTEKDEFHEFLKQFEVTQSDNISAYIIEGPKILKDISEVKFENFVIFSEPHRFEIANGDSEAESSPPDLSWPYWLMPAVKVDDAIASLEEIYAEKILSKACRGDKKRADRLFRWQVCLIVLGHHSGKIKAVVGGAAAYLGLGKLLDVLKL